MAAWMLSIFENLNPFRKEPFEEYFSKKSPKKEGDIPTMQALVDKTLCDYAISFQNAAMAQIKLLNEIKACREGLLQKDQRELHLELHRARVRVTKNAFWDARNAARDKGFTVRDQVSDYY